MQVPDLLVGRDLTLTRSDTLNDVALAETLLIAMRIPAMREMKLNGESGGLGCVMDTMSVSRFGGCVYASGRDTKPNR